MLIGERVNLGAVVGKDMAALFQWRNNRELSILGGHYRPVDEAVFTEWVAGAKFVLPRVLFVIRKNEASEPIGYTEIYNIEAASGCAEFGIAVADPANRRRGYGSEATRLALDYCWNDLNLRRLSLRVVGDNLAALNMYAKAGFETEGLLRQGAYVDGAYRDVTLMAVLRPQ